MASVFRKLPQHLPPGCCGLRFLAQLGAAGVTPLNGGDQKPGERSPTQRCQTPSKGSNTKLPKPYQGVSAGCTMWFFRTFDLAAVLASYDWACVSWFSEMAAVPFSSHVPPTLRVPPTACIRQVAQKRQENHLGASLKGWRLLLCLPTGLALRSKCREGRGQCRVQATAGDAKRSKLPLPPGKPGNAFLDLLKYVKDPDAYMAEQVEAHGPVFQMNYFGRKTVIVGGAEGVTSFTSAERKITKSALPDTFSQLHTEYGTMNQSGQIHRSSRQNLISSSLCEETDPTDRINLRILPSMVSGIPLGYLALGLRLSTRLQEISVFWMVFWAPTRRPSRSSCL